MLEIIGLQEIEGNWVFSKHVTSLLHVNGEDIKAIDGKKVTDNDNSKRLNIDANLHEPAPKIL